MSISSTNSPRIAEITTHRYDIWTPAEYTTTSPSLNVIPSELIARSIAFSGNNAYQMKITSRIWKDSSLRSYVEIVEGYLHSPAFFPITSSIIEEKGFSSNKLTTDQCIVIADLTRQTIVNRALDLNISVEDPINVALRTLLEKIEKANRCLVIFFNCLRDQIPQAPTFEGTTEEQANAIRLWMRGNQHDLNTITGLNLSDSNLEILPSEIRYFTALAYLDLSNNQLHTLPSEIRYLTRLDYLVLHNNQLHTLPLEIRYLTALQDLDLSRNQLHTLPPEIRYLTHLKRFYLSNNQLHALPLEIRYLTALQKLDLSDNPLETLPSEMSELVVKHNVNIIFNHDTD